MEKFREELSKYENIQERLITIAQSNQKNSDLSVLHEIEHDQSLRDLSYSMWNCAERPVMDQILQERPPGTKFDTVNKEVSIRASTVSEKDSPKSMCIHCNRLHNHR
jgi:response regulator of citrate/malate metabolism